MLSFSTRSARRAPLAALLTLWLAACAPLYTSVPELSSPRSQDEWSRLVEDVRLFQRRIGFHPTRNFRHADGATDGYRFCGHGSPLYLPYSYQDPAIRWVDAATEDECRASAENTDVSFAMTEAIAGRGTPVTAKLLVAPLARFLYVIMHEDCHEQFALPAGIEEALCNALAYAGMQQIARERFSDSPDDHNAITSFARAGAARAEFTSGMYEELAGLYARHDSALISVETLLRERGEILRSAERRLARPEGTLSNVWVATVVTYSRHYRSMKRGLEAFDGDLAQTVSFFRRVDAAKPDRPAFAAKHGCSSEGEVGCVRAYEAAIVDIIESSLP